MPGINKFRIDNATYSDGEKFYDNFMINVDDKGFLTDSTNGQGKTFLAQMIMQTVLPKSHFTAKHPFKELYNKENNNNTIHSLVEWKLEEGMGFDYMVTGFCSRKKPQNVALNDVEEKSDCDFFNYLLFYNEGSKYDIFSIPLKEIDEAGKTTRMSYSQLRKYISELANKDLGEPYYAKFYDTTTSYHKALKEYRINPPEWELIRGVNARENYVEKYFDTFSTPKKFIKDFLIPQIDEAGKMNNLSEYQGGEERAAFLLEIKDTVLKYSQRLESVKELDIIENSLQDIISVNTKLLALFENKESIKLEVVKGYNKINADILVQENILSKINISIEELNSKTDTLIQNKEEYQKSILDIQQKISEIDNQIKEIRMYIDVNSIKEKETNKDVLTEESLTLKEIVTKDIAHKESLEKLEDEYKAENKYIDYTEEKATLLSYEEMKVNHEKSNEELVQKLNRDGSIYKTLLISEIERLSNIKSGLENDLAISKENLAKLQSKRDEIITKTGESKTIIYSKENDIIKINSELKSEYNKISTIAKNIINHKDIMNSNFDRLSESISEIKALDDEANNDIVKLSELLTSKLNGYTTLLKDSFTKINTDVDNISKSIEEMNFIISNSNESELTVNVQALIFKQDLINSIDNNFKNIEDTLNNKIQWLENELNIDKEYSSSDINKFKLEIATKNETIKSSEKELIRLNKDLQININKKEKFTTDYNNTLLVSEKYDFTDIYECEKWINNYMSESKYEILNKKKELSDMTIELDRLKENKGLVITNNTIKCYNELSQKFDNILLGAEFIKELSREEKELYLDRTNSLIAYSILVSNSDYNKIINTPGIMQNYKDSLVPIINIDAVRSNTFKLSDNMYLSHRSKEEILDEEKIANEIAKKELEITKLSEFIIVKERELDIVNNDLNIISNFTRTYNAEFIDDLESVINSINENIIVTKNDIAELKDSIENITNKIISLEEEISIIESDLETVKDIKNIFNTIKDLNKNILVNTNNINDCNISNINIINYFNELLNSIKNNQSDISNLHNTLKSLSDKLLSINDNIKNIENNNNLLSEKISNLNSESTQLSKINSSLDYITTTDTINLSLIEAEKIYERTYNDSKGKITALDFLKDSINKVKKQLDNIEKEINDYEFTLDYFKNKECFRRTDTDFKNLKEEIKSASSELKRSKSNLRAKEDEINGLNAIIKVDKKKLKDTYKVNFDDIVLPELDFEAELTSVIDNKNTQISNENSLKENISSIDKELNLLRKNETNLNKERNAALDKSLNLSKVKNQIETLISNEAIDITLTKEMSNDINYVLNRAKKDLFNNKQKINHNSDIHTNKINTTKSLLANSAFNFIDDLNELYAPTTYEECKNQISDISGEYGYIYLLEEEKASLKEEIESLQECQETFVNLCVQRCNYALNKMLEIEEFSKVDIGNKKISAIQVHLNPLPEDERKVKMRNYITNIVESIDTETIGDEKMKELTKMLELKNLFPQVLKDINTCNIKIFKINSTCDGGKYIDWGKAGSSGQTNSMYVFFYMCIMIFIRRLSSNDVKQDSRKFMLLDSPFNGTQALNLWKIPLEVMRRNNVQLMCLGYQVPPQLTGLFDVRLVLGETKMSNGKGYVSGVVEELISKRNNSLSEEEIFIGKDISK